jgi:hypothetical protein
LTIIRATNLDGIESEVRNSAVLSQKKASSRNFMPHDDVSEAVKY